MFTIILPRPIIPMDTVRISHSTDSIITAVDLEELAKPTARTGIKEGQSQDIYSDSSSQPDLSIVGTQLDTLFREKYQTLLKRGGRTMKIIAVIGSRDKGCLAYAKTIERCCQSLDVEFERVELDLEGTFEDAKLIVEEVNKRERVDVDGMIMLTPIFGGRLDEQLRACITPGLDIEALSPIMAQKCTSTTPIPFQRVFSPDNQSKYVGTLFPCTPMSVCTILMSLKSIWDHSVPSDLALNGKNVTIINRSAVFGKPLALMLANAGANVYSIDINDIILFHRPSPTGTITSTLIDQNQHSEILGLSDIIISAVPDPDYRVPIPMSGLKPGVGLINVATGENFCEIAKRDAGWYIPRVGGITRRCLMMNALMGRMMRMERLERDQAKVSEGTRHEER